MKSQIQISNSADRCQIDIEGVIGVPEEWQFDNPDSRVATYEKFRESLRRITEIEAARVVVNIRSTGGNVADALLIYDALSQLKAHITTRCFGYTASAATLIAQAASKGCRQVSPNSLYLIHNATCATEGNVAELTEKAELLRQTDRRIAAIYAERSGRPEEEFVALMGENNGNGRWLSPEETLTHALADALIPPAEAGEGATRNLVRGWERLLRKLGMHTPAPLPDDRHPLTEAALRAPVEEQHREKADALRRRIAPTTVMEAEDPSTGESARSANDRAYAEDALSMKR